MVILRSNTAAILEVSPEEAPDLVLLTQHKMLHYMLVPGKKSTSKLL